MTLRTRLFSFSKKSPAPKDVPDAGHISENSTSTSATLTPEPAVASHGQDPSSATAGTHPQASPSEELTVEVDREQASVDTTLTGQHQQKAPFYRRRGKNKVFTSDGALSSLSATRSLVNSKDRSAPRKGSLFSRVVHRVVPCVNAQSLSKSYLDEQKQQDSLPMGEKAANTSSEYQSMSIDPNTAPPITIQPPSPSDSDIIVPPPPSSHLLPQDETDGLTSGAVQPPGSTADVLTRTRTRDSYDDSDGSNISDDDGEATPSIDEQAEEERLIFNGGSGIPIGPDGVPQPLLPPISPEHVGRKCLILDLDETLVHSSFRPVASADFVVPVEIESHWHHFHVLKRPGVDDFLRRMGKIYEVVVFTASLSKYADPVLDKLDLDKVVAHRLFRESCFNHRGNYVKDLSQLGRPIAETIILDNSPASYVFHPNNAVPVSSWFNDPHDAELTDLIPFLADLTQVSDVRGILNPSI